MSVTDFVGDISAGLAGLLLVIAVFVGLLRHTYTIGKADGIAATAKAQAAEIDPYEPVELSEAEQAALRAVRQRLVEGDGEQEAAR